MHGWQSEPIDGSKGGLSLSLSLSMSVSRASTRLCTGFFPCFGVGHEGIQMNIARQVRWCAPLYVMKEGMGVKAGDRLGPAWRRHGAACRSRNALHCVLAILVARGRRNAFFFFFFFIRLPLYGARRTFCLPSPRPTLNPKR